MKVLLKILKVIGIIILIIIAVLVAIYFYKIDLDNIGITGFFQGGVGVFNVLTKYEEASYFKVTAVLSPVSEYMTSIATDYTYDSSEVKIPIMIFAGTEGEFEPETVLPLAELR